MTQARGEHLQWCKDRALEYVDQGDLPSAWASFASDMGKHEETKDHSAIVLGHQLLLGGHLGTADEMRKFINGFN
jgi:hypothetical protein